VIAESLLDRRGRLTPAQRQLQELLTDLLWHGEFDRAAIQPAIRAVLDERTTKQPSGPFGSVDHEFADYLESTFVAVQQLPDLDEGAFLEARARQRQAIVQYAHEWASLRQHPTFGSWFEDPTLEMLVNKACPHLLTNLGMRILADQRGEQLPPVHIEPWTRPPQILMRLRKTTDNRVPRTAANGPRD
jgi:hypothetical protein